MAPGSALQLIASVHRLFIGNMGAFNASR